jgi:hypothetical protein
MPSDHDEFGARRELQHAQEAVWKRHKTAMQRHFATQGITKVIWSTKIAI